MKKTMGTIFFVFLLLYGFLAGAFAGDSPEKQEHWFGASTFPGFSTLIEISSDGPKSTIEFYGTAPLHYEFPLGSFTFERNILADGTFSITFSLRGQDYILEGERYGDVIAAQINGGDPFRFFKANLAADPWEGMLPGLYEGKQGRYLVTFREFGGMRAGNLNTGENFSLLKTGPRNYFTWQGMEIDQPFKNRFRFPKDEKGKIVALVVDHEGGSETFYRTEKIQQEQFKFQGQVGELAGTILRPKGKDQIPGIVFVHGSGPIYRSALVQRAVGFVEMGYAVLIYDKRGTGRSEGRWQDSSFEDLADDALGALATLEAQPNIDKNRTGFQGHSQAGYILPIAATKSIAVDFVIIVNGGSIIPWEQSLFDKENDLNREGFSDTQKKAALTLMRRVYAYVLEREGDLVDLGTSYVKAQTQPWFETTDFPRFNAFPSWQQNPEILEGFRDELSFDPKVFQRRMAMPVLVLLGEDDETVPAEFISRLWRQTMKQADSPLSKVVMISGTGHGMRQKQGGVFVPLYLQIQRDWLVEIFVHSKD